MLAWGVGVALLGISTTTAVALVLLAAVGVGNTVVDVAAVTLLQRSAADSVLGRVFGVLETVLLSALGLGSILAPLAIHLMGVRAALVATGLVLPVVVVVCMRALVTLDRPDPTVAERAALLRAHPIFRPLAEGTLEQVARAMEPVAAGLGAAVIRQGDTGDRVYLVASGDLAVDVDGRPGGHLGPGDVFGEIALLRDVPRTATVRALTARCRPRRRDDPDSRSHRPRFGRGRLRTPSCRAGSSRWPSAASTGRALSGSAGCGTGSTIRPDGGLDD